MGNILIVFSGKAQSGKTTSCNLLRDYIRNHDISEREKDSSKYPYLLEPGVSRVQIHTFAAPLKDIAKKYFGWDGIDKGIYMRPLDEPQTVHRQLDHMASSSFEIREEPIPDRGRQLLINIGMKFREIRPTIWCDYTFNEIVRLDKDKNTVPDTIFTVDDMRFKNELKIMKSFHSCYSVRLHRDSCLQLDEQSEKDLDYSQFDYYIDNNGTKEELTQKLAELYHKIVK